MGENLDTGPIKLVRFVPANDIAKSITAKAINKPPIMLINDGVQVVVGMIIL